MKSYTLDYTSYINENSDKEQKNTVLSSLKEYLNILKQNPEYARPIFRGVNHKNSGERIFSFDYQSTFGVINYVKPLESRNSLNAPNYGYDSLWNLWLSNNTDWKKYPSRKHNANICTTDYDYAGIFGIPKIVIPVNIKNTKFGICGNNDLFDSFKIIDKLSLTVKQFCDFFIFLTDNIQKEKKDNIFQTEKLFESYEQIFKVFNYLDNYFLELIKDETFNIEEYKPFSNSYNNWFETIYNFYKSNNKNISNFVSKMLNPTKNGFQLANNITDLLSKIKNSELNDNEIWFNGDYIAIYIDETHLYHKLSISSNEYINLIEEAISNLESVL